MNLSVQNQASTSSTKELPRLSRDFYTTVYDKSNEMSTTEVTLKSVAALTLGILPFALTNLSLLSFRISTKGSFSLEECIKHSYGVKRGALKVVKAVMNVIGILFAATMMGNAKLFALSQKLIWRFYVAKPSGDRLGTRLAKYGIGSKPWEDLKTIYTAFFNPDKLTPTHWSLKEWSQIKI
jgi:hypothetical protein